MNESHLAIHKTANKDFVGLRKRPQRGIDVLALRMPPPASLDGPANDGFDKIGCAPLCRGQDDAALLHECPGIIDGEARRAGVAHGG